MARHEHTETTIIKCQINSFGIDRPVNGYNVRSVLTNCFKTAPPFSHRSSAGVIADHFSSSVLTFS